MTVTYIYPPVDGNPTDLYNGFVTFMQTWIPGWQPYSGELDDWLARAFTGIAAQLQEITSDVATSIFRYFGAYIVNVPPYDATPATGTVTITVQDTAGYTVPAFTQFSFSDGSGNLQGFETLTDTVIPSGSSEATGVLVQAMTAGSAGNGCSGAGDLDGSTPITFITGVTLSASTGGLDAEDDTTYLNRLTQLFTTLTPSPITVADFTAIALTQSGVGRAVTIGGFNPASWTTSGTTTSGQPTVTGISSTANIPVGATITGTGIPSNTFVKSVDSSSQITLSANATASGTVTLTITGQLNQGGYVQTWVADSSGAALTSPQMSTIQAAIQAECLTNVVFNVAAPTSTTVNVTTSVVAWPGQDPTAIQAAVQSALTAFLEPSNFGQIAAGTTLNTGLTTSGWLNDNKIRVVVLENVIMNVLGVHYVSSLTINGGSDLSLGGVVPLPAPGTMTVTVTNG